MATKFNIVNQKNCPKKGAPGSLYWVRDARPPELLLASRTGELCPVTEFFSITVPEGPAGKDGRDGRDGADGTNGVDGQPGAQGPKGDAGDLTVVGDAELHAALLKLKKQKAEALAHIQFQIDGFGAHADGVAKLASLHLSAVRKKLLED